MMKLKVRQKIVGSGLVAVVRAESSEQAAPIADACAEGGVAAIEITFTVPSAVNVIRDLAQRFTADEIPIAAGTVLDPGRHGLQLFQALNLWSAPVATRCVAVGVGGRLTARAKMGDFHQRDVAAVRR